MISFRFHVVSLTAVFLGIAIGVVVGTTYLDRLTVDRLENRIEAVEDRADETRRENDRLEGELGSARDFIEVSADYAVTDRLVDVPVAVVAVRGVDEEAVERTVLLARRAGAIVPGVLWLESRWGLAGEDDLDALGAALGSPLAGDRSDVWAVAWEAVVEELTPSDPTDVGPGVPPSGAALGALEEAGFISVDSLDDDTVGLADMAGAAPALVVVTGTRADEAVAPMVVSAVGAAVDGGLLAVVADVHVDAPEGPGRGAVLRESLEPIREQIVIVDALDRSEGRVAAVLAVHDAAAGTVGLHYGYGDGADGVLPAWTEP